MTSATPSRPVLTVVVPVLDDGANTTAKTLLRGTDRRIRHVFVDATADGDPRGRVARAVQRVPGSRHLAVVDRDQQPARRRAEAIALALAGLDTEWVGVVDAGDFVAPGFHLRALQAAERLGTDLLGYSHTRVRGPVRVPEPVPDDAPGEVLVPAWRRLAGRGNRVGRLWAQLVRRSVLEQLPGPWLDPRLHHGAALRLGWQLHLVARSSAQLVLPGYFRCRDFQTDVSAPALLGRVRAHQQVVDLARQHLHADVLVPEAVGAALRTLARQARVEADRGRAPGTGLAALTQEVVTGVGRPALAAAYRTLDARERRVLAALAPVA